MNADQLDRELGSRTDEVTAITATLLELDGHPAREHMRNFPPQGVTAQRWAIVEPILGQLWEDLSRMTSILESARAVRANRSTPTDGDLVELTRLLYGRPLEVSGNRKVLLRRVITDPSVSVGHIGLAGLADRLRTGFPVVAEFFDAVDRIDALVAGRLAVAQKLLDKAGVPTPPEFTDLLTVSATDPLSLTPAEVERRVDLVTEAIRLLAGWPAALADTAARLDALREAANHAVSVREYTERLLLTRALPAHPDPEPALRAEFRAIATGDSAALRTVRHRIDEALRLVRADEALAQGLLDRRRELKGRLSAYQAKAARLGLGEDVELLTAGRTAAGLLSQRPCDLGALTRAVLDFQRLLTDKQGQPS